jgi:PadR family transcriptional regulator, regulatory protein AphA
MSLTMRHYAVLASLAQEPRSGYDIAQWFAYVTRHFCAFGHSSIYPTLADLEQQGLVTYTEIPSEQGPTRKVYRLTPEGGSALLDWVAEPAADAEVRDEQLLKALCYGFIPAERAAELLRLARARHLEREKHYQQIVTSAAAAMAADDEASAAALGRWLTARRGVGVQESYVAWCDEAIAAILNFAQRVGSEQGLALAGEVPAALRARRANGGNGVDHGEDQDDRKE